jgi:uncharacterized protein (UPF0333 family)
MNLQLIAILLLVVATLVAVSGFTYYVMQRSNEKATSAALAREQDEAATLKRYEDELRTLEIKARTSGYDGGDSERYARLIYRRNALLKRARSVRTVTA